MGISAQARWRKAATKLAATALGVATTFGLLGAVEVAAAAAHPAAAADTSTTDTAGSQRGPIVRSPAGATPWCPGPGQEGGRDSYSLDHNQECFIRVGEEAIVHYNNSLTVWNTGRITCFVAGRNAIGPTEEFTTRGNTDSARIVKGSLAKDTACEMIIRNNG